MSNGDLISPADLVAYVNPPADGANHEEQARQAIASARALVEGYTRGAAFTPFGDARPGIAEVVTTVAARILANPGAVSYRVTAGSVTISRGAGFQGFTLAETAVLNRYRKRAK